MNQEPWTAFEIDRQHTNLARTQLITACMEPSMHAGATGRQQRKIQTNTRVQDIEKGDIESAIMNKPNMAKTVNYLAYGSNLSAETFLGRRGIKPISQLNVCVPSLRLTFNLPAIPYLEPCFANTERRDTEQIEQYNDLEGINVAEKESSSTSLSPTKHSAKSFKKDYHKDRWHKPLVGVLYELTAKDYAHVIATEGGGAAYTDITVDCYPLDDCAKTVPMYPESQPVKGHTLFAPAVPSPSKKIEVVKSDSDEKRLVRPDPSYAQASKRYLKLITDGAREHNLPQEYQEYLAQIRPFRITTIKQRFGQLITAVLWIPFLQTLFLLAKVVTDDKGRAPEWMTRLFNLLFQAIWVSYDGFFKKRFGDGERTIDDT